MQFRILMWNIGLMEGAGDWSRLLVSQLNSSFIFYFKKIKQIIAQIKIEYDIVNLITPTMQYSLICIQNS